MALTKEDLSRMKLPLSDDDYQTLLDELPNLPFTLRSVSTDLDNAFDKKASEIYNQRHPGNNLSFDEIDWEPPLTEEEKVKFGVKSGGTKNNQNEIAMRELTYNLAPRKEGEEDDNLSRMNRWEEAQGMKLSELTDEEWVDVIQHILVLTRSEAEEYLDYIRASNV